MRFGALTPGQSRRSSRRGNSKRARAKADGGEGGIRTHVPLTRQIAFEAIPVRPLRYLSARAVVGRGSLHHTTNAKPSRIDGFLARRQRHFVTPQEELRPIPQRTTVAVRLH